MLQFLRDLKILKQKREATATGSYVVLLRKSVANDGKLSEGDTKKFDELVNQLGRSIELIEADAVTIQREQELAKIAATVPDAQKNFDQAKDACAKYVIESAAKVLAKRREVGALPRVQMREDRADEAPALQKALAVEQSNILNLKRQASARLNLAKTADADLAKLRLTHPQLFSETDEYLAAHTAAEEKRTCRHLVHHVPTDDLYKGATFEVMHFETLISGFTQTPDLAGFQWVKLLWQSSEEFQDMLKFIPLTQNGLLGRRRIAFLKHNVRGTGAEYRHLARDAHTVILSFEECEATSGQFDPTGCEFPLYPGQRHRELDGMVAQLHKAHECWLKKTGQLADAQHLRAREPIEDPFTVERKRQGQPLYRIK